MKFQEPLEGGGTVSGVRRVYALCFLFLMEVIERLGTDKALELLSRAVKRQAEIIKRELAASVEKVSDPLDKGLEVYSRFMSELGAWLKVQSRSGGEILIRLGRCPIYEAFLSIGLECGYWMEGLCSNIVLPSIEETLRKFDLGLRLGLKEYRESADEPCLVRLSLEVENSK